MTSDCMDDRQGEAMKPSPSPAAMTEEELAVWLCEHYSAYGGAAWEKRTHAQKRVWRQDAKDICALIAASRGTRALTEEEAATVRTARRWKAENNLNNHEQNLLAIISRLTGEPSA